MSLNARRKANNTIRLAYLAESEELSPLPDAAARKAARERKAAAFAKLAKKFPIVPGLNDHPHARIIRAAHDLTVAEAVRSEVASSTHASDYTLADVAQGFDDAVVSRGAVGVWKAPSDAWCAEARRVLSAPKTTP